MEVHKQQMNSISPEQNKDVSFINNYNHDKKEDEIEINNLKNSRTEMSLSLRKKKLDNYLLAKRKKYTNENFNNDVYINIDLVKTKVPALLIEEFDIYEDKLSVAHQFLNNDFTLLHGMDFNPDSVKLFIIHRLINLTYNENADLFDDKFQDNLKNVFYDIIKIINESKNLKVLFGTTSILINLLFSSEILNKEFKQLNGIWKKFQELSELKNSEINDNLVKIMINFYIFFPGAGKEYILSNYSRYIKQILSNFLKEFDNESKSDKINLDLYDSGITLIKRLINNENKEKNKENDMDVVVKLKYLYCDLVKIFTTTTSWIINKMNVEMISKIYEFLSLLIQTFSSIAQYADEETYEMNEFQDVYFVNSLLSLIRIFILNENNELDQKISLNTLIEIYNFLGSLFSFSSKKTEIYSQNKIIIYTEEVLRTTGLKKKDLIHKIIFFLSNYVDNKTRCAEIFEDDFFLLSLKQYSNENINEQKMSSNLFFLLENAFNMGDNKCKEIIINNFTYFLLERIKVLSEFIIKEQYVSSFNIKCKLLLSMIYFLEINVEKYSEILSNLIFFLHTSNLEEILIKVETNAKNYDKIIIPELLLKLKPNQK